MFRITLGLDDAMSTVFFLRRPGRFRRILEIEYASWWNVLMIAVVIGIPSKVENKC